jgi:hypothetical protein
MSTTNWAVVFAQLAGQSPLLLVYLIGLVLCAIWWRRAPRPAMFAMIGCGVLLLTHVGVSFVQVYYINNRGSMPAATVGQIMAAVAFGGSILRAFGFVLVLSGVFADRPRVVAESGFEVHPSMRM